jgi:hypothetical protein
MAGRGLYRQAEIGGSETQSPVLPSPTVFPRRNGFHCELRNKLAFATVDEFVDQVIGNLSNMRLELPHVPHVEHFIDYRPIAAMLRWVRPADVPYSE